MAGGGPRQAPGVSDETIVGLWLQAVEAGSPRPAHDVAAIIGLRPHTVTQRIHRMRQRGLLADTFYTLREQREDD